MIIYNNHYNILLLKHVQRPERWDDRDAQEEELGADGAAEPPGEAVRGVQEGGQRGRDKDQGLKWGERAKGQDTAQVDTEPQEGGAEGEVREEG